MKLMYQDGYVPDKVPTFARAHARPASPDQQMRPGACRKSKQLSLRPAELPSQAYRSHLICVLQSMLVNQTRAAQIGGSVSGYHELMTSLTARRSPATAGRTGSRTVFCWLALMLVIFAVWGLTGFAYPATPVPFTLNLASKIVAFATMLSLFLPGRTAAAAPGPASTPLAGAAG
jgi:hypothetical protein